MTERPLPCEPTAAGTAPAEQPTIPGYRILSELGRGGMGVVYQAEQLSSQSQVALKLIRDNALAGPQERARFRIESEAAARMQHPSIVQILEVGEHQGRSFYAMELIAGPSLESYLARRPQPPRQAAELLQTLALAVQHAHEKQIVHRDLKPANVLLQASSDPSVPFVPLLPKITDFGLAKRLNSASTAWTQEGAVLGTASYMAPEQAAGRVSEVGPAVDIYALGAILYEMLTGRPPFAGATWNETLQQVIYDEPQPPRRSRPGVPADLEAVCLKCLEKDPARRYGSAADLAGDLGRFLTSQPVAAVAISETDRLARLALRDGYRIVGEIGRGPRSIVYHAVNEALQQPVALKVFAVGLCTAEEWDAQLRRGATLRSMLAHSQIIPIQGSGRWNDAPYLAVELIPQGSLALKRFALEQAIQLVEQIAEVVSYIHRQGHVHGNLKPSNVLLAADGIPRLIDFQPTGGLFQGTSRIDDSEPDGVGYLAPELAADFLAEPRFFTDIYGLGIILYELLTGRPPFVGTTAAELLEHVRAREPDPPSRFNAAVTPHLDAFSLRCLRKNPWRRFSRAYDVQTGLRHLRVNLGRG